ncbi:MAG: hypothetical protein KGL53_12585 [Elusimicrobia bacterium]|nr:hypothetical protein [Elusimicrobiota bacterium]
MSEEPILYSVILTGDAPPKPMDLARAVAKARKVPALDLAPRLRSSGGIVEEKVPKEEAETVEKALETEGIAALAVPASLLEELPEARAANSLEFLEGALAHGNRQGGSGRAEHRRLVLVCAATLSETVSEGSRPEIGPDPSKQFLKKTFSAMTGIPTSLGGKAPEFAPRKAVVEDYFLLEFHWKDPAERVRVDSRRFDFSCLGARKGHALPGNVKVLVSLLKDLAPHARLNRGAKVLFEGRPMREMGYENAGEFEREARRLLTLAALNR